MVVPSIQEHEAEEVPLHKPLPSEQARCNRVTAAEDTLILLHSEAIEAANIMDKALCEPWGTIGPSLTVMLSPDVMVGKTLFDAQKDYVPVRVVNLSGEPRKVCSGTEVVSCEPVQCPSLAARIWPEIPRDRRQLTRSPQ